MDWKTLHDSFRHWLQANAYRVVDSRDQRSEGPDLVVRQSDACWSLFLVDGLPGAGAGSRSFDSAVGRVIKDARSAPADRRFALCIPLGIGADRIQPHLRRAMKKYSNSVVFEDLQLSLWLVVDGRIVEIIPPAAVNAFLRSPDAVARTLRGQFQDKSS